jgi:hypothetical protein
MTKLNGLELKRARLVPSSMFASPEAVVRSRELSRSQKIQILRRWEFDARCGCGGDAIMAISGDGGMLLQVRGALAALGALSPVPQPADPLH